MNGSTSPPGWAIPDAVASRVGLSQVRKHQICLTREGRHEFLARACSIPGFADARELLKSRYEWTDEQIDHWAETGEAPEDVKQRIAATLEANTRRWHQAERRRPVQEARKTRALTAQVVRRTVRVARNIGTTRAPRPVSRVRRNASATRSTSTSAGVGDPPGLRLGPGTRAVGSSLDALGDAAGQS